MQLTNGTLLQGGKYKIERVLGQGGFGITYLANQSVTIEGPLGKINADIKVCIKEFFMKDLCNRDDNTAIVTIPSLGSQEFVGKFRLKFMKEASNISKLKHPNIIKVTDVFEENGTAYYVMEYVDGGSLNDLIKNKGKLVERDVRRFAGKIADALRYIHSQNMNHLDIKPGNILLKEDGDIVLIDFGLAKNYDISGEQTTSTPIGVSVGYAPLEQSRIGGVGTFSPPTDIYSLGATMYKMLTGQTPPEASEVMDEGLPTFPSGISENMIKVVEKAMEPRRKDRYQTIEEMLNSLRVYDDNSTEETVILPIQEKHGGDASSSKDYSVGAEQLGKAKDNKGNSQIEEPQFLKEDDKEATRIISLETVIQSSISNDEEIDLGLSVNWRGFNLDANSPEESGRFYPWCASDKKWSMLESEITGSNIDYAHGLLGGKWRMPRRSEFKELIDKCRWSWMTYKGVNGCKITGPSGKSIFLPASGKTGMNGVTKSDEYGYYWTGTKSHQWGCSHYLYFNSQDSDLMYEPIAILRTIRPVCDK